MIKKEYKSIIKDIDDKGVVIIAANAFNNIDKQNDVSLPGSFKRTIANLKNIYWYKNHDNNETLGIIQKLWEDDQFLIGKHKFNLEKEISRNMYSDYKFFVENNSTIKHSVGVSTTSDKIEIKDGIRYVKEWRLYEVSSLTKQPANDLAVTIAVKNEDFDYKTKFEEMKNYFEWIAKKGLHTEEFIRTKENELNQLINIIKSETAPPAGEFSNSLNDTLKNKEIIDFINKIKF